MAKLYICLLHFFNNNYKLSAFSKTYQHNATGKIFGIDSFGKTKSIYFNMRKQLICLLSLYNNNKLFFNNQVS